MAVGVLSRSSSQSEITTTMTRQRRNGMAYIFHGQSSEHINYLRDCFTKRLESLSSESDFETASDSDIEVEALVEALRDVEKMNAGDEHVAVDYEESPENEFLDYESQNPIVPAGRRFALVDIFEGVPENQVSEFLAHYSSVDADGEELYSENSEDRIVSRTRRFARGNIFEGIPRHRLNELLELFHDTENDVDAREDVHSPNHDYLFHRRGALADIFLDVVADDVRARLVQCAFHEVNSSSDGSESPVDSDDSDVQMNGHSSDSSLPDEGYLWRRRCALANIFEDIGATENRFRAQ